MSSRLSKKIDRPANRSKLSVLDILQFLDEIDYSLAFKTFLDRTVFKTISDKITHYSDAMDSYYNCIWDPTLLEFIVNLENKKGEHKRKQQAVSGCSKSTLIGNI